MVGTHHQTPVTAAIDSHDVGVEIRHDVLDRAPTPQVGEHLVTNDHILDRNLPAAGQNKSASATATFYTPTVPVGQPPHDPGPIDECGLELRLMLDATTLLGGEHLAQEAVSIETLLNLVHDRTQVVELWGGDEHLLAREVHRERTGPHDDPNALPEPTGHLVRLEGLVVPIQCVLEVPEPVAAV